MVVNYVPFAFPGLENVHCAFQMSGANISYDVAQLTGESEQTILSNRQSLKHALGFSSWLELRQVHGPKMYFNHEPIPLEHPALLEADGHGTDIPGHGLIIKTADCQPILLAHASGKYIAGLHAGWRGNRIDFPVTGVRDFCTQYNLKPEDLLAVRGPSLGPAKSEFTNFDLEWGAEYKSYFTPESKTMDLWQLTRDQLVRAGLKQKNIFSVDLCTYSLGAHFYSYRKDRNCGRQASVIWMAE